MLIVMALLFYYREELPFLLQLVELALLAPLLIYTASKIQLSGNPRSLALLGGELSYPIYALHYPIFAGSTGLARSVSPA
jgi:peptidoglycan/LPS O-acetylase OafA/YrhL